ncbi:MAG: hypothetical protein KBD58_09740, partial [Thermomonas sp.]|nr:hypothetical protein [Thermomonas sp.]
HRGVAFVEVLLNCVTFHDGAYEQITSKATRDDHSVRLRAGQPMRYGKDGNRVLVHAHGRIEAQVLEDGQPLPANAVAHDPTDPGLAQQLALMAMPELPCALGIFRQVQAPVYGQAC